MNTILAAISAIFGMFPAILAAFLGFFGILLPF